MTEPQLGGYTGKLLRVNLTDRRITTEDIEHSVCRKFLGGAGFVAYYVIKEIPAGIDPLGEENKLVFAAGPITGTPLPGNPRHCVGGVSPLTGTIAKSEVGEYWGVFFKRAGFDVLIVEGASAKPVTIVIDNQEVYLKDADHLWGMKTKETQEAIRRELGSDKFRISSIGPGGENKVLYACIMCGLADAAGRGGLGAVMGAKKLKAIAVKGDKAPRVQNSEVIKSLSRWLKDNWNLVTGLATYGTSPVHPRFEEIGNLPIRNFRDGAFPTHNNVTSNTIKDTIRIGMEGCWGCPIKCKKVVKMEEPYPVDPAYGGPEYETCSALGPNCGVDNLNALSKANELCNAYSLDTISTGCTIAFAMECFENGLITREDTGGIDLSFGSGDAVVEMVEQIAHRKGLGDLLAQGAARAAKSIGKGAEKYAMEVKGLEIPMHEPRLSKALGLGYMLSPIGADHVMNILDIFFSALGSAAETMLGDGELVGADPAPFDSIGPKKVYLYYLFTLKRIVQDSLVICGMFPYNYRQIAQLIEGVVGWNTTVAEQFRIGQRILTAMRWYNVQNGFTAADDRLPRRFFEPRKEGNFKGCLNYEQMEQAKKYYYSLMGWNDDGVPGDWKLEELGLAEISPQNRSG
ncbi:MAG: aldehyde ferredoxin oxidoreductase family protein [Deltaproteobacteria bacterium]|nr:aldehyde ferredoxin oxidoreductase family protein [Deltaproteobacteria bacterium]